MDEKVLAFFCQDEYLKQCHEDGLDIYASFASKIFVAPYEECLEWKDNMPFPLGKKRRASAKAILCACWSAYSNDITAWSEWLNNLSYVLPLLS